MALVERLVAYDRQLRSIVSSRILSVSCARVRAEV